MESNKINKDKKSLSFKNDLQDNPKDNIDFDLEQYNIEEFGNADQDPPNDVSLIHRYFLNLYLIYFTCQQKTAENDKKTEEQKKDAQPPKEAGQDSGQEKNGNQTPPAEDDSDARSIFVKNVHFAAKEEDVRRHFKVDENAPDEIKRVTILKNKFTQSPLG